MYSEASIPGSLLLTGSLLPQVPEINNMILK